MSAEQALETPATHVRRKSLAELARITALPREEDELLQHAARLGKFLLVGNLDDGGDVIEGGPDSVLAPAKVAGVVSALLKQDFMGAIYAKCSPSVAFLNIEAEDQEGFPVLGDSPTWENAHAVAAFVREHASEERRVLIHCREGRNRSVALAIATEMLNERRLLGEVLEEMWSKRPFVLQNVSFREQLTLLAEREGLLEATTSTRKKTVAWAEDEEVIRGAVATTQDSCAEDDMTRMRSTGSCNSEECEESKEDRDDEVLLEGLNQDIEELEERLAALKAQRQTLHEKRGIPCSGENVCMLNAVHVKVGRRLGAGSFGAVYQGTWRGMAMALKFCDPKASEALRHECGLMDVLEHPNIVMIYGICVGSRPEWWPDDVQPPCLCCELLTGGTLLDYIRSRAEDEQYKPLHWITLSGMMRGAASGLVYLHSQGMMHRDLKSENILLDGDLTAKLADFGLAKAKGHSKKNRHHSVSIGTYTTMAPEVMTGQYSLSCDIFSFGITCSEVLTRNAAEDIIDQTRTNKFGLDKKGLLAFFNPALHSSVCFDLIDLAVASCELDPVARPDAQTLVSTLSQIASTSTNSAGRESCHEDVHITGQILHHNPNDNVKCYKIVFSDGTSHWFSEDVVESSSRCAASLWKRAKAVILDERLQHDLKLKALLDEPAGTVHNEWKESLVDNFGAGAPATDASL